jgi:hypothetical protein
MGTPDEISRPIFVYYVETELDRMGLEHLDDRDDGWSVIAEFEDGAEDEALAFAEAEASVPHPAGYGAPDRIVVISMRRGMILNRKRPRHTDTLLCPDEE